MIIDTGLLPEQEQHLFALYTSSIQSKISDKHLIRRIKMILRLRENDQFILFDDTQWVRARICSLSEREIILTLSQKILITVLEPKITWILPLLKREAFEAALYALTELGATAIQPVVTHKSRQTWGNEKEHARARAIMLAAAEQSKQFALPQLKKTIDLAQLSRSVESQKKIYFDMQGASFVPFLSHYSQDKGDIVACSGPEGDLTRDEKDFLRQNGFIFYALTPTVVRAQQAVTIGLGILRTILRQP